MCPPAPGSGMLGASPLTRNPGQSPAPVVLRSLLGTRGTSWGDSARGSARGSARDSAWGGFGSARRGADGEDRRGARLRAARVVLHKAGGFLSGTVPAAAAAVSRPPLLSACLVSVSHHRPVHWGLVAGGGGSGSDRGDDRAGFGGVPRGVSTAPRGCSWCLTPLTPLPPPPHSPAECHRLTQLLTCVNRAAGGI